MKGTFKRQFFKFDANQRIYCSSFLFILLALIAIDLLYRYIIV